MVGETSTTVQSVLGQTSRTEEAIFYTHGILLMAPSYLSLLLRQRIDSHLSPPTYRLLLTASYVSATTSLLLHVASYSSPLTYRLLLITSYLSTPTHRLLLTAPYLSPTAKEFKTLTTAPGAVGEGIGHWMCSGEPN
jgi:hypothetical protein